MGPPPAPATDLAAAPAYSWDGQGLGAIARLDAPPLALLRGIDRQRDTVAENVARHAAGADAHDMLLWGARGMGKSALIRASVLAAADGAGRIALVQAAGNALDTLSTLMGLLGASDRRFLLFIDDIGFGAGQENEARLLRSLLEGGVSPRPANVRIAVTSNRRAIVARHLSEQDDPINPRDSVDDALALADRFGLSIGFHNCSQDDYLAIVAGYAEHYGLAWDEADALEWSKRRGARSGRVARHYVTELAGRVGRSLEG
ncbi:ATP-binding protein [Croceicoccus sp. BE223]|uniref:ATP-binding protein n=1 Tax=Croceicoccus sp. BE223 TaxID=2817716 RepID=UPI00286A1DD0|nr:ATP-binding protein [Croceicoccus sp. BE223]